MRTVAEIRFRGAIVLTCFVALSAASACDPNIEQRERPEHGRVEAVFDPGTSTLPLPNGVATGEGGRLPDLLTAEQIADPNVPEAEKEFAKWFSSQHGWPIETPIEIPFSGKLKESTVNQQNIMMFQLSKDGAQPVAIEKFEIVDAAAPAVVKVRIIPASAVAPGATYTVVVNKKVEDEFGSTIVEPLPIFFASSTEPLVDSKGTPTVSLLADQPETAKTLEDLRKAMQPLFTVAKAVGVERNQVAMLFGWSTTADAYTVLDPATATIPLPNTLGLDEGGTFPRSALCSEAKGETALSYFEDYLGGLNGWPASTPIVLPLNGPVDAATLTEDTVQLWRIDGASATRVKGYTITLLTEKTDRCTGEKSPGHSVALTLPEEMDTRAHYFAFATREIKGSNGNPLLPPAAMAMALQPNPVLVDGKSTISRVSNEQAQSIAGVQQVLAPAVAAIKEATGIEYNELASVWSWFTWLDTFVVFDPAAGQIPFPSTFLIDQETGLVNLPIPGDADPLTAGILNELNQRHGFSLSAPGWVPLDGKLDPATISNDTLRMFAIAGLPARLDNNSYVVTYEEALDHLIVTPLKPYAPDTQHVGLITTSMHGINGKAVQPTAPFVMIRSPYPLVKDGKSLVPDYLDDATAAALEPARAKMAQLFQLSTVFVGAAGREGIAMGWPFDTDNATRELQELRAKALYVLDQRAGGTEFVSMEAGEIPPEQYVDPNRPLIKIDMSNVGQIYQQVEFDSVNFLNNTTGKMGDVGSAASPKIGVSVFVPKKNQGTGKPCDEPYDVVIGGHGLNGDRWSFGLAAANELAAYPNCLALVTMDLPLHGGRIAGSADLHPEERPATSGDGFLSTNLLLTKGLFQQAAVDLSVLTQAILGDGTENGLEILIDSNDQTTYFSDKIGYLGMSMGGIIGTLFITVEPDVSTAALSVAGGKLTWLLEGTLGQGILQGLEALGVLPGTFMYVQTLAFIQWVADVIDPFTFAPFTSGDKRLKVLAYDPADGGIFVEAADDAVVPVTDVMMQMAVGDLTVPNRSTELLADTIGVSLENTTFTDVNHGFFTTRDVSSEEYPQGLCARKQAAQWLRTGLRGTAELSADLYAATCVPANSP